MECKKALDRRPVTWRSRRIPSQEGHREAEKRAGRTTSEGVITSYIHPTREDRCAVELNCETDFVARTMTSALAREGWRMHIASAARWPSTRMAYPPMPRTRAAHRRGAGAHQREPEHLVSKIVEESNEAFYKQVALLSQPWIRETRRRSAI